MQVIADAIKLNLDSNGGKISPDFIDNLAANAEYVWLHPTLRTRLCIMTIYSGHEIVGKAQVLDADNDVKTIGEEVAFNDAKEQLWQICGSIALAI